MTRRLLGLALLFVVFAGAARADTYSVVASDSGFALPSSETPNAPGTLAVPPDFTSRPAFVEDVAVSELQQLWRQAGDAYGIPWQVLAAINKIETDFGHNLGPSSAGALGWMQFMPSTWLSWGLDASGDGSADPWNAVDAIFAAARYLAASGGRSDLARAVFAYNHAGWYVAEVLALAGEYAGGASLASSADLAELVAAREQAVADARANLAAALPSTDELTRARDDWIARAEGAELLSDRLEAQKQAAQVDARLQVELANVERLRVELENAEAALAETHGIIGVPYQGTHVLYGNWESDNAIDVSAAYGTPVYAVEAGTIGPAFGALDSTDPRLQGLRLHLITSSNEFYYAHLSSIAPGIEPYAYVEAGQLLGYTGEAAGVPHLHFAQEIGSSLDLVKVGQSPLATTSPGSRSTGGGPTYAISSEPQFAVAAPTLVEPVAPVVEFSR